MKTAKLHVLAGALIGLGWAAASGAAFAGGDTATRHAEMRQACTEQGGRFEQSWSYNDQGMQWGKVRSCSTSRGFVTCQDAVCRSDYWDRPARDTTAAERPEGTVQFPAEPVAFASALAALAEP